MTTEASDASLGRKRRSLRALIGCVVGVGLLGGLAYQFHISRKDLLGALQEARIGPLLLAAGASFVLLALQTARWRAVVRPVLPIDFATAYGALSAAFFLNTVLPARAGTVARVVAMSRRPGVGTARLSGAELVDYWVDKCGWVTAFLLVCLTGRPPSWLWPGMLLLTVLVSGALGLALLWERAWPPRPEGAGRWRRWFHEFQSGVNAHQRASLAQTTVLLAPLPWVWESLVLVEAGRSFGLSLTVMAAFAVLSAFNLGSLVPSPGKVGAFESAGTLALVLLGVEARTALAFMLLYHLTQLLPNMVLGALLLGVRGGRFATGAEGGAPSTPRVTSECLSEDAVALGHVPSQPFHLGSGSGVRLQDEVTVAHPKAGTVD